MLTLTHTHLYKFTHTPIDRSTLLCTLYSFFVCYTPVQKHTRRCDIGNHKLRQEFILFRTVSHVEWNSVYTHYITCIFKIFSRESATIKLSFNFFP